MHRSAIVPKAVNELKNSKLILFGFATAFFPRLLSFFGAPSAINFAHFFFIPAVVAVSVLTTKVRDRRQIAIAHKMMFGLGALLICVIASAVISKAGITNVLISYLLLAEPFLLLLAIVSVSMPSKTHKKFRQWLLGFALSNLLLAVVQSVLMPIGIYPRPAGGTLQDNIAGMFGGGGGSAGNYISCTISAYFAIYAFFFCKQIPAWIRYLGLLGAFYQIQVSDSKQVFLALLAGGVMLIFTQVKEPQKFLLYIAVAVVLASLCHWILFNVDSKTVDIYKNFLVRDGLFGWEGEATQTKLAAFRIIPTHYESLLNNLFGLGPGHSVSRLGGWVLRDYRSLLVPLGATIHPASNEIFRVVFDGWIATESTIFFPLFTWAGIWGDLGIVGLGCYLYLCYLVWTLVCVDSFGRYLLLTTMVFGFILTQMEEPGHMLTVACLLGLRWHEAKHTETRKRLSASHLCDE